MRALLTALYRRALYWRPPLCGCSTVRISTPWTMQYGRLCKTTFTRTRSRTRQNCSSTPRRSGTVLINDGVWHWHWRRLHFTELKYWPWRPTGKCLVFTNLATTTFYKDIALMFQEYSKVMNQLTSLREARCTDIMRYMLGHYAHLPLYVSTASCGTRKPDTQTMQHTESGKILKIYVWRGNSWLLTYKLLYLKNGTKEMQSFDER